MSWQLSEKRLPERANVLSSGVNEVRKRGGNTTLRLSKERRPERAGGGDAGSCSQVTGPTDPGRGPTFLCNVMLAACPY